MIDNRLTTGLATCAAGIIPLMLGLSLGWPIALWLVLTILTVMATLFISRVIFSTGRHRAEQRHLRETISQQPLPMTTPPPPPPPVQVFIADVALHSALPDYDFRFAATVYWRPVEGTAGPTHPNPGALAVDSIIERAEQITRSERLDRCVNLQHQLHGVLGDACLDRTGRVEAWADQVRLSVSENDLNRLRAFSELRKDKEVWAREREHEVDKRAYLSNDVLRTTGSAIVWWLARNDTDIAGTVDLIGALARLAAAAKDQDVPELFAHLVPPSARPDPSIATMGFDGNHQPFRLAVQNGAATLFGGRSAIDLATELMNALHLDGDLRVMFASQIAKLAQDTGDLSLAQEIRRRFDLDDEDEITDADPTEPVTPTGPALQDD